MSATWASAGNSATEAPLDSQARSCGTLKCNSVSTPATGIATAGRETPCAADADAQIRAPNVHLSALSGRTDRHIRVHSG